MVRAMDCPACGHAVRAQQRFCNGCGGALSGGGASARCPACAAATEPGDRFCAACGTGLGSVPARRGDAPLSYTPKHLAESILSSRRAVEGERKQVTVLFADVKGSMELAERARPRGVAPRSSTASSRSSPTASTASKAPSTSTPATASWRCSARRSRTRITRSAPATRRCTSATSCARYADELRRERGLSFSVRIGINSGEVVVGTIGDDLRMDYTAQGHTVGLAARMEQLAEPGRVYLTEHTARARRGLLPAARPRRVRASRASREPVRVYELERRRRARARGFDVSRARGLSRFVGRDAEMARARDGARRERCAGDGQVVGVVGEAGRRQEPALPRVRRALPRARHAGLRGARRRRTAERSPSCPMLELLRALLRHRRARRRPQRRARRSPARCCCSTSASDDDAAAGVRLPRRARSGAAGCRASTPRRAQRQLFARAARARAAREPSASRPSSLFEDLHWIDAAARRSSSAMVDADRRHAHARCCVNFRPEYRAAGCSRPHYRQHRAGAARRRRDRASCSRAARRRPVARRARRR